MVTFLGTVGKLESEAIIDMISSIGKSWGLKLSHKNSTMAIWQSTQFCSIIEKYNYRLSQRRFRCDGF